MTPCEGDCEPLRDGASVLLAVRLGLDDAVCEEVTPTMPRLLGEDDIEGDSDEERLGVGRWEYDALLDCVDVIAGVLEALPVMEGD